MILSERPDNVLILKLKIFITQLAKFVSSRLQFMFLLEPGLITAITPMLGLVTLY